MKTIERTDSLWWKKIPPEKLLNNIVSKINQKKPLRHGTGVILLQRVTRPLHFRVAAYVQHSQHSQHSQQQQQHPLLL
jgi:hypothetical protein